MIAEVVADGILDRPGSSRLGEVGPQEVAVGAVPYETQILTIGLAGGAQPHGLGLVAHIGFGHLAHRQANAGQFVLAQHVEDVRLIFGGIERPQQPVTLPVAIDPSVVAGHEHVTAEGGGPLEEGAEAHGAVALDAGIRGLPRHVDLAETFDDVAPELVDVVEDVIRHIQLGRHPPGVLGVADGAAAGGGHRTVGALPLLERHPDDLVSLFEHERRRH